MALIITQFKLNDLRHVRGLPMRQLSTRDQMTQKLTIIGHSTAFNNEKSSYCKVSYKRPRNDKCKTIQTRKLTALFKCKK